MNPKVSIVIPTYNRAEDLKRALKSIFAQTYINWEAVIVDNHSNDNTDEIISSYNDSRLKLFKIHNNGIIAASRNLGINNSLGEYIAFLDSDDWWKPSKLSESLKYLENGMDIVYHELFLARKKNQRLFFKRTKTRVLQKPVFKDLMINGNGLSNSSVVVRKKFLDEVGGLSTDSDFVAMEDYDAWLRISKLTENFFKIPKVLGYYWIGGGNITNPERLFKYIAAFKIKYCEDIQKFDLSDKIYWTIYAGGRAFFLLENDVKAQANFSMIHFGKVPLSIYLKKCWMMLIINLRRLKKGQN